MALRNIEVVDLTQHLSDTFCTMLLADMVAEIVKVEPQGGDASLSPQYPVLQIYEVILWGKGCLNFFLFFSVSLHLNGHR